MIGDIFLMIVSGICILMNIVLIQMNIMSSNSLESLKNKYNELVDKFNASNRHVRQLQIELRDLYMKNQFTSTFIKRSNDIPDDTISEALKMAMKQSHPDNGGSSEDFIKFKQAYDQYMK